MSYYRENPEAPVMHEAFPVGRFVTPSVLAEIQRSAVRQVSAEQAARFVPPDFVLLDLAGVGRVHVQFLGGKQRCQALCEQGQNEFGECTNCNGTGWELPRIGRVLRAGDLVQVTLTPEQQDEALMEWRERA